MIEEPDQKVGRSKQNVTGSEQVPGIVKTLLHAVVPYRGKTIFETIPAAVRPVAKSIAGLDTSTGTTSQPLLNYRDRQTHGLFQQFLSGARTQF